MAQVVLLVGKPRSGKTFFLKKLAKKSENVYINDINNDFKEFNCYEDPANIEGFIDSCTYVHNTNIIIDEATIYFGTRSYSKGLKRLMVLKAHSNNNYFLVFHSIMDIPRNILVSVDKILLFKTLDPPSEVLKKFSKEFFENHFLEVKKSKNKHFFKICR